MEGTTHLHIKDINDYNYYVIQFLELPREDMKEIVVIPWMWIVSHSATDQYVLVAHPVKITPEIKQLIRDREKKKREWKSYKSLVIYKTDSYNDAEYYALQRMNEVHCNTKNGDRESSAKINRRDKQSAHSTEIIAKLPGSNDTSTTKTKLKRKLQTNIHIGELSIFSSEPTIIATREFLTNYFTLMQRVHTTTEGDDLKMYRLSEILKQNVETMREAAKLNEEVRATLTSSRKTPTASTLIGATAEVEKISEEDNKEQDDGSDSHDNDEVANNKRSRKFKFVPPPEYDANDSRWTLKHRELAPGLVELVPKSRVYINENKLKYCLLFARDGPTLARMLFLEIFTETAMSLCAITGGINRNYDAEKKIFRPSLDRNATNVILNFVRKIGREKHWKPGTQSIMKSIRNRMLLMRNKCESNNVIGYNNEIQLK